jgi:Putative RNA methylase family UPF0020
MTMQLNEDFEFRGPDYSTTQTSSDLPRHRWYLIKEGFSPKIVDAAIDSIELGSKDLILDPFCGSGTVPLTAALRGIATLGIEVNPFLAFVSNTKLKSCDLGRLNEGAKQTIDRLCSGKKKHSLLEGYSTFSRSKELQKWLFNTDVLRAFTTGWYAVQNAHPSSRRFLRLALTKAAMDNCNARADGKCLRYRKGWKKQDFGSKDFTQCFRDHIQTIIGDIESLPLKKIGHVANSDSRSALANTKITFRLCITSPPYLNSFDYSDVYRPELFLSQFVSDNDQLRQIRLRTVRSHVQTRWSPPKHNDFGEIYRRAASDLLSVSEDLWDKRIPLMVQAYFEDMKKILKLLHQKAKPDAQAWIVVSTSAYGGVEIPVDLILAQIAESVGWFLYDIGVIRHLRHSGHHWSRLPDTERPSAKLRESVVVLGKRKKK